MYNEQDPEVQVKLTLFFLPLLLIATTTTTHGGQIQFNHYSEQVINYTPTIEDGIIRIKFHLCEVTGKESEDGSGIENGNSQLIEVDQKHCKRIGKRRGYSYYLLQMKYQKLRSKKLNKDLRSHSKAVLNDAMKVQLDIQHSITGTSKIFANIFGVTSGLLAHAGLGASIYYVNSVLQGSVAYQVIMFSLVGISAIFNFNNMMNFGEAIVGLPQVGLEEPLEIEDMKVATETILNLEPTIITIQNDTVSPLLLLQSIIDYRP